MAATIRRVRRAYTRVQGRHTLATALSLFTLLLGACGDAPSRRTEVRAATGTESTGVVDWDRRAISLESAGWSIEFCEGEGPFLCVGRESRQVGSVELFRIAVRNHTVLAEVLGRGGSELEALDAAAAEFVSGLSADRRGGYGEDYQLRADRTAATTVIGEPGLRVVLEGRLGDRILERIVHYYAIQRDTSYLLAATGTERGGHLGEFTTEDLKQFEPLFAEIAAASRVHRNAP